MESESSGAVSYVSSSCPSSSSCSGREFSSVDGKLAFNFVASLMRTLAVR